MAQYNPAQREFLHRLIDWDHVRCRLNRYPAIKRAFPLKTLKKRRESPPYYCHYMSWRLGTWEDESLFQRLEELLCCTEKLPDWKYEHSLLESAEFGDFWSLIWQLQVAEYLCEVGKDVRWAKSGPDLSVERGSERCYVECYVPHKSFGLLRFIEDLFQKIDPSIRLRYDLFLPFQLPRNSDRCRFLDEILTPFLDPTYLAKAKKKAKQEYPVVLYKDPNCSLYVYVEGEDADAYMPGIVPNLDGDPESYVETVLKEAAGAKRNSNNLKDHRPNLVTVNLLLSEDFQVAKMLPHRMQSPILPQLGPNIDALGVSVVGINERLTREKLKVVIRSEKVEHSLLDQITS